MKLRRILRVGGLALVVLVAVVLVRTFAASSRQPEVTVVEVAYPAEKVAARLAEALRFRTISSRDPGAFDRAPFHALLEWFAATYPQVYASLEVERHPGPTLLLRWTGSDPALAPGLLMAHLDVVPVEPGTEDDWTHDAFAGVVADGYVWGRGALDVKSGAVALHEALDKLLLSGHQPERTLCFAFGHDEEVGGGEGNGALAQMLAQQGEHFAFVIDEGGFVLDGVFPELGSRPVAFIDVAEKGYCTVALSVQAEGGHSSMPPRHTAVGRIARAVQRLEADPFPIRWTPEVRAQFEWLAPEMPFFRRMAFANLWLFSPLVARVVDGDRRTSPMLRTTTAATVIAGGVQENVVPQAATATVNFRLLPGTGVDEVLEHVRARIDDDSIQITLGQTTSPASPADPDSAVFLALARSAREVHRDCVVVPALLYGATDSRHYGDLADEVLRFSGLRLPLDDTAGFHGTNERIGVTAYAQSVQVVTQMILNLGQALGPGS